MTFNDEFYLFGDSNVARYNFTTHSADMLAASAPDDHVRQRGPLPRHL